MIEIVFLLVVLSLLVGGPLLLYLAIDRETSDPTVVNRSEAEQIAQDRGGRPEARERRREQETDDFGEWGTDDEWGASRDRDDRR
ncbi:MAG: hypothetical protein V5A52_00560 [Halovenus sp.]|uniref:hypothetical protein n=1 Tax=Halovenus amylolytica TaxID=2500550 RepID=UPI000FE3CF8A